MHKGGFIPIRGEAIILKYKQGRTNLFPFEVGMSKKCLASCTALYWCKPALKDATLADYRNMYRLSAEFLELSTKTGPYWFQSSLYVFYLV